MTCITSVGGYQDCQSHGCDASLRVSSNLFVDRHEYTHTQAPQGIAAAYVVRRLYEDSACVRPHVRWNTNPLNTFAHTAAQLCRVATKLAEQIVTACLLSLKGVCLFIHAHISLGHDVKCEV